MENPLRLSLQVLQICGVQTTQPVYVKFLWRGEKQKSPLLRPMEQQQQQLQAEFLLPYDQATDGTRLLIRLWAHQRLRHRQLAEGWLALPTDKENVGDAFVAFPALGPGAGLRLRLQLRRFDATAHRLEVQQQLMQEQQVRMHREQQQRHEQHLAMQDMQQQWNGNTLQHQQHYSPQQHYPQLQQQYCTPPPQQQFAYLPPPQQQQLLQQQQVQQQPFYPYPPNPHSPQQQQQHLTPQQQQYYAQQQQQYYAQQQATYNQQQQQQQQQQATGSLPNGPTSSSSSSRDQAVRRDTDEEYIHSILPQATPQEIRDALARSGGDREKAVDLLLRAAVEAAAAGHVQEVQQQQHEAAAAAAAAPGPSSAAYTADIPPVHPQGPIYPQGSPVPQQQQQQRQQQQQALLPASVIHQPSCVPHQPGRRKALLIGINYFGTRAQLRGCVNDARRMQQLLRGLYGFGGSPTEMVVLTDDNPDPIYKPTRKNILSAMRWLTLGNAPGDALFFHYSGHGSRRVDSKGIESDGYDETILPLDWEQEGQIVDDELHEYLVQPLHSGCRLTGVMDSCHSGSGLDLPFVWSQSEFKWKEETNPFYVLGDVQLFSGCEDSQTSADLQGQGLQQAAGGAMTTAFVSALTQMPFSHSYPSLMDALSASMKQRGLQQRPQLTSSQRFTFNRPFSLTTAIPNTNQFLGRRIRRLRKPQQRGVSAQAVAGGALAATGAIAAGLLLAEILDPR